MWGIVFAIIVAGVLATLFLYRSIRRQGKQNRIIRLSRYRKAKGGGVDRGEWRPCSICHKPAGRLHFYADETGRPIGVCDRCRPLAEKRELLRI